MDENKDRDIFAVQLESMTELLNQSMKLFEATKEFNKAEQRVKLAQLKLEAESLKQQKKKNEQYKDALKFQQLFIKGEKELIALGKNTIKYGAIGLGMGAAGLYTMKSIANDASDIRKTVQGLNVTAGQLASFKTNLNPILDSIESFLKSTTELKYNTKSPDAMYLAESAGVSAEQLNRVSTFDLALKDIVATAERYNKLLIQNPAFSGDIQTLQAYHIDTNRYSFAELQRLHEMSLIKEGETESELQQKVRLAGSQVPEMDIKDIALRQYQDLEVQWNAELQKLKATAYKELVPLSPKIISLINSIGNVSRQLLNSGAADVLVQKTGEAIQTIADTLANEDFKSALDDFLENIKGLNDVLDLVLHPTNAQKWANVFGEYEVDYSDVPKDLVESIKSEEKAKELPQGLLASYIKEVTEFNPQNIEREGGISAIAEALKERIASHHGNVERGLRDVKSIENEETYKPLINKYAEKYNVDPALVAAVMQQESGFKHKATSPAGAGGLMQLMPDTAKDLGVRDRYNPEQNIEGGVKYLAKLQKLFPNRTDLVLAGYNAGENAVMRYNNTIPPYPETQDYVKKVTGYYNQRKQNNDIPALLKRPEIKNNDLMSRVIADAEKRRGQKKLKINNDDNNFSLHNIPENELNPVGKMLLLKEDRIKGRKGGFLGRGGGALWNLKRALHESDFKKELIDGKNKLHSLVDDFMEKRAVELHKEGNYKDFMPYNNQPPQPAQKKDINLTNKTTVNVNISGEKSTSVTERSDTRYGGVQ